MLQEFIETLECIATLLLSPWSYRGGKSISSDMRSG
jgi:hypothetical protein